MASFTTIRGVLMEGARFDRRVATIAARMVLGVDTVADLEAAAKGPYGRPLLTEKEFRAVMACVNSQQDN